MLFIWMFFTSVICHCILWQLIMVDVGLGHFLTTFTDVGLGLVLTTSADVGLGLVLTTFADVGLGLVLVTSADIGLRLVLARSTDMTTKNFVTTPGVSILLTIVLPYL